jgi:DHA2 family multidrug resistance protein
MTAVAEHPPASKSASKLTTTNPYIGVLAVFLGAATSTLTGKLISTGLPDLRGALGFGFDDASWIPTAFNMGQMFTGVFATFLGAVYGIRRVLLLSGAVFTASCLILPWAPNLGAMLALLAITGFAAGPFYTLTMTFVARNLPQKLLLFGIAAYAMDIVVTSHFGVFLQGWTADHLSWRWIFWCGALLMPLTMLCVYFGIAPSDQPERPNWRGLLYTSAALSLIYGALDQGQRLDWWNSGTFVGMAVAGAFLALVALVRRHHLPNPFVNLKFLAARNVVILGFGIFTIRFALLGSLLIVPGFLGAIQQYRPIQTGGALAWVAAPQFVVVWVAAILAVFIQPRIVMAAGFTTIAIACWVASQIDSAWAGSSFRMIELALACGIGAAFVSLVTNIILQIVEMGAVKSVTNTATYSALMHTFRLLGGQIGAVAVGRYIAVREQFHSNLIGQNVDAGNWPTLERFHGLAAALAPSSTGSEEAQARSAALLAAQVKAQAFTLAYSDAFLLIAWGIAAYLTLLVFLRPSTISLRHPEKAE